MSSNFDPKSRGTESSKECRVFQKHRQKQHPLGLCGDISPIIGRSLQTKLRIRILCAVKQQNKNPSPIGTKKHLSILDLGHQVHLNSSGCWYTYLSEKYESIGMMKFPTEWKNQKKVPDTTNQSYITKIGGRPQRSPNCHLLTIRWLGKSVRSSERLPMKQRYSSIGNMDTPNAPFIAPSEPLDSIATHATLSFPSIIDH